jgi:hypothetical protein
VILPRFYTIQGMDNLVAEIISAGGIVARSSRPQCAPGALPRKAAWPKAKASGDASQGPFVTVNRGRGERIRACQTAQLGEADRESLAGEPVPLSVLRQGDEGPRCDLVSGPGRRDREDPACSRRVGSAVATFAHRARAAGRSRRSTPRSRAQRRAEQRRAAGESTDPRRLFSLEALVLSRRAAPVGALEGPDRRTLPTIRTLPTRRPNISTLDCASARGDISYL